MTGNVSLHEIVVDYGLRNWVDTLHQQHSKPHMRTTISNSLKLIKSYFSALERLIFSKQMKKEMREAENQGLKQMKIGDFFEQKLQGTI